jgi:hypothetical protein
MLIKLTPVWLVWSKDQNLTPTNYSLTNFSNGILTIHCDNAIGASQLKHQQQTLLNYFHIKEFSGIEQINIRVSQPSLSSSNNSLETINSAEAINSKATFTVPSTDSLKSIQACRNGIKNDHLSNSLSKLEKTLANLKKKA